MELRQGSGKISKKKVWRSCKKVKTDSLPPFSEAKLGAKLIKNLVFAVPPSLVHLCENFQKAPL